MNQTTTTILTATQVQIKLQRIAYEILENNYQEKELILLGVNGTGEIIAQILGEYLRAANFPCIIGTILIHKKAPMNTPISYSIPIEQCRDASVIFVDDVANSGKTLFYAMHPLMHTPLKSLRVAVLIDRQHKQFPITADYVGLSLSTGLHEHIQVEPIGEKQFEAYLK